MRKYAIGAIAVTLLFTLAVAGPAFATDDKASSSTTNTATTPSTDAPSPTPAPAPKPKGKMHMSSDPDHMWAGLSLGINLGYSQSDGDTSFNPLPTAASFANLAPQSLLLHPHGVVGGVGAGYDMQHRNWVFGLAADFSGTGITMSTVDNTIIQNNGTPFGNGFLSARETVDWLATIRGRAGFVVDKRVLFYATGGLAGGGFNYRAQTDFNPGGFADYVADINRIRIGWTVGAGAEYAIHHHWHAGVEYLYYEFSSEAKAAPSVPVNGSFMVGYGWTSRGQIARGLISYKF
jgi:outer membrane immunogenic protein